MHLPTTATLLLALLPTAFSLPNARPEPQTNLIDALLGDLTGQGTPPLMTTNPSPECVPANGGELTCCGDVVDGGNALVQSLAKLGGYALTKNTINGLFCKENQNECEANRLCCQVVAVQTIAALYCQAAPPA